MLRMLTLSFVLTGACAATVLAHHGWGSYDASKPITVVGPITIVGPIQTSKYENPHVFISVKAPDKVWNVVLAPTSRMLNRGALKEMVAVGKTVTAFGYPSTAEKDEMRAERITVDGKTVEMR